MCVCLPVSVSMSVYVYVCVHNIHTYNVHCIHMYTNIILYMYYIIIDSETLPQVPPPILKQVCHQISFQLRIFPVHETTTNIK